LVCLSVGGTLSAAISGFHWKEQMMNSKILKILSQSLALMIMAILLSGTALSVGATPVNTIRVSSNSDNASLAVFSQLDLYPNIETIGVVLSGANLPKTVALLYRQDGEAIWHSGHPLVRIDDGRLVGSLFELSASTSYSIKVVDGSTEIAGLTTTQPNDLQFTPQVIVHVNDDAPSGGDGSVAAPFKTIQEGINRAGPGTQILVADGVYHEAISFPGSGAPGNWIQVKAEGNGAILDGSTNLAGSIWKPHASKKNVWFTRITAPITYLALDQKRFYAYDNLNGLLQGTGHNNVQMNEGWYFEPATHNLYVRSLGDPATQNWQMPYLNRAFDANGRDWLWIEGLEMRFYGGQLNGCGICALNASHLVIRNNNIHNVQLGVFIDWTGGEVRGNDVRIEYNEIHDPAMNVWPWAAVKGTSMEGTAIVVRGHIGAIVRGNELYDFFNGIYTGSSAALENPGIAFDTDIYNNYIHHVTDDGLEPEGASINQRFRDNTLDTMLAGISIAPVTQGPVWVLHSSFANYTGRGIKWDRNSDGIVLVYHNTFWTNAPAANGMDMISPVYNAVLRNNIFQGRGYAIEEIPTGSTGHDWNYDNWYTTRPIPHFKWENVLHNSIAGLCAASGLECKGYEDSPGLTNPGGGDFSLLPSSPNINRGVAIPGLNDNFAGSAPDVGAFEFAFDQPPMVVSSMRADTNPTNAGSVNFTVTFSESVTGLDAVAPFSDLALIASAGITGAAITSVTPLSVTTYNIGVNTGSGTGTIQLVLLDDDSIVDIAGNSLGGAGAANGNFNGGEVYAIEKGISTVLSVLPVDRNPSIADSVHFTVVFSGEVTEVDGGDFSLTATGSISGAVVAEVGGSGNIYTVTVNTGSGDGTLRLDVADNDSIIDAALNPLGGVGTGNGNFIAGGIYTMDKNPPIVISNVRIDPNPSAAGSIRYAVTFSETVTGVDAGDFVVASTGVSGASVTGLSGSGNTYTVTVSTGTGNGTLRLDVIDNDSIGDLASHSLGGAGAGNGNYTAGDSYTINKLSVTLVATTFRSTGANDGWLLESNETSNQAGTGNSAATTFNLGDNKQDRQYRAILHFATSSLPDNAIVTQVILMIKAQGVVGTNPFITHQNINVDIRNGYFGSSGLFGINSLDLTDFQAPASMNAAGVIQNNPVSGWYWTMLDGSAGQFVNLQGVTQLRLMFQTDDNDDLADDYLALFSGNYGTLSDRPHLLVEYYLRK
jgi:hypothetical protein